MSKLVLSASLLTLLVAGSAAQAAEVTLGIQGHLALPTGKAGNENHLDGKTGYGFGFNLPVDFGGGHILRPKADYISFRRDSQGINSKSTTLSVLADSNDCFAGKREGAYFIAGLGFHSTERELSGYSASIDTTSTGLAYTFGVGYAFNKTVAVEAKYMGAELSDWTNNGYWVDSSYTANAHVLPVSISF